MLGEASLASLKPAAAHHTEVLRYTLVNELGAQGSLHNTCKLSDDQLDIEVVIDLSPPN